MYDEEKKESLIEKKQTFMLILVKTDLIYRRTGECGRDEVLG